MIPPSRYWSISNRADPLAVDVADRHYNRQKVGTPQFVPPGRCLVLFCANHAGRAMWTTSWPFAEFTKHAWAGAWVNSAFRNEGAALSSDLIREAIYWTCRKWPVPDLGMITFIDRSKVKAKGHPGYCYRVCGFDVAGESKGGLLCLQLSAEKIRAMEAMQRAAA